MKKMEEFLDEVRMLGKITIVPNCYQIIKTPGVDDVAIGLLRKAFYILDAAGEPISWTVSYLNHSEELPTLDASLIKLLNEALVTTIEINEHCLIFASEELVKYDTILVGYKSLFGNLGIFPVPSAKKQPDSLYYQIIATGDNTTDIHCDNEFKELAIKDLHGIGVPFVRDKHYYKNRYYISVFTGISPMYQLPVLIGADFSASYDEGAIRLESYDSELCEALHGWKCIKPKKGSIISRGWKDLSAMIALTDYTALPFT